MRAGTRATVRALNLGRATHKLTFGLADRAVCTSMVALRTKPSGSTPQGSVVTRIAL
jgi:hypothetical protein